MTALALAFLAGAAFGAVYFAALWLSVRRLTAGGSAAGFAVGALVRLGLALGALALVLRLDLPLPEIVAAAAGFIVARLAATRVGARRGEEP